jgi:hypothetical protein
VSDSRSILKPEKEDFMLKNFEEVQKVGQQTAETATKAFGTVSNGVQAIATELAGYSKKSFEEGTKFLEQLLGTKSVEKAIELQQSYFKNAYEGFVAQATKIGGLYADLAKETYKPLEGFVAKITPAK